MNEKLLRKRIDTFCETYIEEAGIPQARKELADMIREAYSRGFHRC